MLKWTYNPKRKAKMADLMADMAALIKKAEESGLSATVSFAAAETKRPRKKSDAEESAAAASGNNGATAAQTVTNGAAKTYTLDEVRSVFLKYMQVNGKESAGTWLKVYGAGKISEVKATDYPKFVEALTQNTKPPAAAPEADGLMG